MFLWRTCLLTNFTLPYNAHVTHYILDCSYIVTLKWNFTIDLRSLWTRFCWWCNGWLAVLNSVRWKDIGQAQVYFTDGVILAAYRCIEELKLNFDSKLPGMNYLSWSLSLRIHCVLAAFSRSVCNCGILTLCIQKQLNWIWIQRQRKNSVITAVCTRTLLAIASPWSSLSLVDSFFFAGQS